MELHHKGKKEILLHADKDGYYPVKIEAQGQIRLRIVVDKHINASLCITYHGVDIICDCEIQAMEHSSSRLLFWNELDASLDVQQRIQVEKNANMTIGYGDVNACEVTSHIQAVLCEEGASLKLLSACVSAERKHYEMNCIHEAMHTESHMENYCVVKEHGDYRMLANGQIKKGAAASTSLQATRVLTMSEDQRSEVIPLLLIDENEVKAGHATTVGQPDENQLYYLQTRGLTRKQALSLLIIGYMMPITEVIERDDVREQLQIDIEEKVGYHA